MKYRIITERFLEIRTVAQSALFFVPFTLILCSPLGWGKMSTHMTTSPTASTPDAVRTHLVSDRLCVSVSAVCQQLRYVTFRSVMHQQTVN